jgi:FkbM family methyltransferase
MTSPARVGHGTPERVEAGLQTGLVEMDDMPPWLRMATGILRRLPAGRYRLSETVAACRRQPFIARMPEPLGGFTFECDLRDAIAREVCLTGCYEPQETALMKALVPRGGTVVDVGANWGYFTLVASHLTGVAGAVLALEPDPRCFAALQRNLSRNRLRHARALPVAATDLAGDVRLHGYDPEGGNSGLSRLAGGDETAAFVRVAGRRLDDVLHDERIGEVDVVKMDVEGSEPGAMKGLSAAIAGRRIRALILELHPAALARAGVTTGILFEPLLDAGYTGHAIDHTPAGSRRAAYARDLPPSSLLRPLGPRIEDEWPHVLWLRRGERLPA